MRGGEAPAGILLRSGMEALVPEPRVCQRDIHLLEEKAPYNSLYSFPQLPDLPYNPASSEVSFETPGTPGTAGQGKGRRCFRH